MLDRKGLDHAAMRLGAPANDTRWYVPEDIKLVDGYLTWPRHGTGRPTAVAGTAMGILDAFVRLAAADDDDVRHFAERWGVLNICRHGMPASHVPHRVWQSVTEFTGAFDDDAADNYNPCRPAGLRRLREPVERWRHFAGEAKAVLNIAASLHRDKPAPIQMWTPLEEMFGVSAPTMLGERGGSRTTSVADQRTIIARVVQSWLELGDVAVAFNWTQTTTTIEFGSHCLFGALALQLALAVARSQGLAVCMNCGRAYPPSRRPAPGRNNYCDLSECGPKAAQRDWARRKAQG